MPRSTRGRARVRPGGREVCGATVRRRARGGRRLRPDADPHPTARPRPESLRPWRVATGHHDCVARDAAAVGPSSCSAALLTAA
jgi:hypothetical protein